MMGQSKTLSCSRIIFTTLSFVQVHTVIQPFTSHRKLCNAIILSQNHFPEPNRHIFTFLHPNLMSRSCPENRWRFSCQVESVLYKQNSRVFWKPKWRACYWVGSVLYKQMAGHFEKQKHSLQWAFSLFKMPGTLFFFFPLFTCDTCQVSQKK